MIWLLPALSAIGTAIGGIFTLVDLQNAQSMEDSMTQMDAYIAMLNNQMTLEEFIQEAWPSMLLIMGILLAGYIIATPKRRYVR
jgi:ABC-type spermidine/putrescine transport system permease subunit I